MPGNVDVPRHGQFATVDELWPLYASASPYHYNYHDPINWVDPSGYGGTAATSQDPVVVKDNPEAPDKPKFTTPSWFARRLLWFLGEDQRDKTLIDYLGDTYAPVIPEKNTVVPFKPREISPVYRAPFSAPRIGHYYRSIPAPVYANSPVVQAVENQTGNEAGPGTLQPPSEPQAPLLAAKNDDDMVYPATMVFGIVGVANGGKVALLEIATKAVNPGTGVTRYIGMSRWFGRFLGAGSLLTTAIDGQANGWKPHHLADVAIGVVLMVGSGPVFWALAAGFFVADMVVRAKTGKGITEHLFDRP